MKPEEIFKLVNPSVVRINLRNGSQGSGFFITPELIVTNYHVIDEGYPGTVQIGGTIRYADIKRIVKVDIANDLAILRVELQRVKPLRLSEATEPEIGEDVYAVGSPKGQTNSFLPGSISQIRKKSDGTTDRIQFDASVSKGASGGPLVDSRGRVIGVIVSGVKEGLGLNFAIPVSKVKRIAKEFY